MGVESRKASELLEPVGPNHEEGTPASRRCSLRQVLVPVPTTSPSPPHSSQFISSWLPYHTS
jgi:hypothetical protein